MQHFALAQSAAYGVVPGLDGGQARSANGNAASLD